MAIISQISQNNDKLADIFIDKNRVSRYTDSYFPLIHLRKCFYTKNLYPSQDVLFCGMNKGGQKNEYVAVDKSAFRKTMEI